MSRTHKHPTGTLGFCNMQLSLCCSRGDCLVSRGRAPRAFASLLFTAPMERGVNTERLLHILGVHEIISQSKESTVDTGFSCCSGCGLMSHKWELPGIEDCKNSQCRHHMMNVAKHPRYASRKTQESFGRLGLLVTCSPPFVKGPFGSEKRETVYSMPLTIPAPE